MNKTTLTKKVGERTCCSSQSMFLLSTSEPHYPDYTLSALQSPYTRSYRLNAVRYRQPSTVYPFGANISRRKTKSGTRDTRVCPILLRHMVPQTSTLLQQQQQQHTVIHAYPRLYQQPSQGLEGSSLLLPCLKPKALTLLYQEDNA